MSTTGPGLACPTPPSVESSEARLAELRRRWLQRTLQVDGRSLADAIVARALTRA